MAASGSQTSRRAAPESLVIVGAGAFGLSTAYALLTNPHYDQTRITILDQWRADGADGADSSNGVTPASIDNSRLVRPDYASKPYARLGAQAQRRWRAGWPFTLPTPLLSSSRLPLNPACDAVRSRYGPQPYRESGLLLSCWEEKKKENKGKSDDDDDDGNGPVPLNPRGPGYVDRSLENMLAMAEWEPSLRGRVDVLKSRAEVSAVLGTGGDVGDRGYLNRASGWTDAGAAIAVLRERTKELIAARKDHGKAESRWLDGRDGEVSTLTYSTDSGRTLVTGVQLAASGSTVSARLVVLATGAWSPRLLPRSLGRRIKATGQVMGYVRLSSDEATKFAGIPAPLSLSTGLFGFPSIPDGDGKYVFKAARHGWGYDYPVKTPDLEPRLDSSSSEDVEVHLPAPHSGTQFAEEASLTLRQFMRKLGLQEKPWLQTRTCWYADSATGEWLIDYTPTYGDTLLVATGDSGHGYKFTPVIGEWIVKALEMRLGQGDRLSDGTQDAELEDMLKASWRWRNDQEDAENWVDGSDGSRGGVQGMLWRDEIAKGAVMGEAAAEG